MGFNMVWVVAGWQRSSSRKTYRKVVHMRRLHPLPDISDGNFGRTKKRNPYYYSLKHGLSHGIGNARLAPFLFEKNVPKVHAICHWHALSDAISDEKLGRTKKLNPY